MTEYETASLILKAMAFLIPVSVAVGAFIGSRIKLSEDILYLASRKGN